MTSTTMIPPLVHVLVQYTRTESRGTNETNGSGLGSIRGVGVGVGDWEIEVIEEGRTTVPNK